MRNHTPKTESDWRKILADPPGVAERLRERLPEIERALAFFRELDRFRIPEMPLTTFGRQPAELQAVQASASSAAIPEATVGHGQISWQTARDCMISLRRYGESFTALRDLAARVGWSEGLIRNATKQDVGLRTWAAESKRIHRPVWPHSPLRPRGRRDHPRRARPHGRPPRQQGGEPWQLSAPLHRAPRPPSR